jgi:DNA-binding transcriptional ArsR family regulator
MLDQADDLGRVFHALADPGRRAMVERLSTGPASVSELGRHKTGRTRTCSINPAVLRSAESWIAERRAFVERRLDRLGEYLAETASPSDTGPAAAQSREPIQQQEDR